MNDIFHSFRDCLLRQAARYTQGMSKRLQVLLPEPEMAEIQKLAKRERVTVGEWVRRALREARLNRSPAEPKSRLESLREAAKYSFPTADIDQMLAEVDRGY
jgi:hypothetical protein